MRHLRLLTLLAAAAAALGFTAKTWNGTTYEIPDAGDRNWSALSDFLKDVADHAQTTNKQTIGVRVATTSPVTISSTDYAVVTALTVPAAVAVTLPAGVSGRVVTIIDGTGDAETNNITVTPASGQINGASTYVLKVNRGGAALVYNGTSWTVLSEFVNASAGTGRAATGTVSGYLTATDWVAFNSVSRVPASSSALGYLSTADWVSFNSVSRVAASGSALGYLSTADWTAFNGVSRVAASSSALGYLSTADWVAFNSVARVAASSSALGYLSTADWVAFNSVARVKATSAVLGYLGTADWVTFNSKVATGRTINTTAPVTGGGDLSADRTIAIPAGTGSADGYLATADWTAFNSVARVAATSAVKGYLSSTDWTTFNGVTGKAASSTTISTTTPLSGGGDLSANRTLTISQSDGTHNGYLSSTDWTSFNSLVAGSVPSTRSITTTAPLTGGGTLAADKTFAIPAGTSSANGYLASGDWTTFNQLASSSVAGRVSYEDSGTFSMTVSGPHTYSAFTVAYSRVGKTVTLSFPTQVGGGCGSATTFDTASADIPSALRIVNDGYFPVFVQNNGAAPASPGYIRLLTGGSAGKVRIGKDWNADAFAATSTCGWYATSITYQIAN